MPESIDSGNAGTKVVKGTQGCEKNQLQFLNVPLTSTCAKNFGNAFMENIHT